MFELFFGIMWTVIIGFMTWGFYASGANVSVNGTMVSAEEFSTMLGPKIFFGIFWAIGIFILVKGIKKIIRDASTNSKGEDCFGRVCRIYNSGARVNGRPQLKADFLVYIPSTQETQTISEIIGFDRYKYEIGSYVQIKYYNGDINIIGSADETSIPSYAKYELEKENIIDKNTKDTITINRIEYVKKDSIE